ncbi:MAG: MCP four helix bundle domain-containing protein [Polyangiaceae bacterium]
MKLETRLLIALGVMSLLVVAVALSGRMGLAHAKDTTQEILLKDAHLAEEALEARSFTLQLRRYEKDYFLNIGAPAVQAEYLVKWKDAHEALVARLGDLDALVSSAADHDTLRGMQADLSAYTAGFEKVAASVRSGELATPQGANQAITVYKDTIRRLEKTAGALGGASDHRMHERAALLDADTGRTSTQMTMTAILAVAVAILMSLYFTKSGGENAAEDTKVA